MGLTVQELIDELMKVKDKQKCIHSEYSEYILAVEETDWAVYLRTIKFPR